MIHSTKRAIAIHLANELLISKLINISFGLSAHFLTSEHFIVSVVSLRCCLVVYGRTLLYCLWCLKSSVNNVLVYLLLVPPEFLTAVVHVVLQNFLNFG